GGEVRHTARVSALCRRRGASEPGCEQVVKLAVAGVDRVVLGCADRVGGIRRAEVCHTLGSEVQRQETRGGGTKYGSTDGARLDDLRYTQAQASDVGDQLHPQPAVRQPTAGEPTERSPAGRRMRCIAAFYQAPKLEDGPFENCPSDVLVA